MQKIFGGIFDFDAQAERLEEVVRELEDPTLWDTPERAEALGRERVALGSVVEVLRGLFSGLEDCQGLFDLAIEENDTTMFDMLQEALSEHEAQLEKLEFRRMFPGKMDPNNAYLDINSGSGGTEAQDWAEMLLRMYLRFAQAKGFDAELVEVSPGDVAGIKSATVHVKGPYAFGWLRTESGVHRLVRKSPFDSGNRRHTSFASVFVSPEVEDDIEIEINPADLRVDTYRASGAGGQHVNRTDSAIRITHEPTGIVVQCQSDRSQHKNRAQAMKQLKAKLYELEEQKRREEQNSVEATKADNSWGSQIRSYVLDQSRIKDLRTNIEDTDTTAVLNGRLDRFIEASLKQGL